MIEIDSASRRPASSLERRMARANGGPRGRPPHKNSKAAPPEAGDEQGAYAHAQLILMDNRFRARLLRAFERGKENRQAAAATYASPHD